MIDNIVVNHFIWLSLHKNRIIRYTKNYANEKKFVIHFIIIPVHLQLL